MKVLIVALCMVGAFVKGQEADHKKAEWFENMKKEMESSPCYPLMKQLKETEADCEDFTSALVTDEEIQEIMTQAMDKMKEKFGDKFKGKEGKGCEKGFGGGMLKKQLCAVEKLGLVNEETKCLDLDKFAPILDAVTDTTVKTELTAALDECIKAEYTSEAKFVNQNMCFAHKSMKICATEKQKEMFAKFHGGKAAESE